MTDDMVVVQRRRPLPENVRRHPLATLTGIELFGMILAADHHWRPLTARQKTALTAAYDEALHALPPGTPDGTLVPLPPLQAGTHPSTLKSLVRRHLATSDGRLTLLAVEVLTHRLPDKPSPAHDGATYNLDGA